jgi:hypothetical protein
MLVLVLVLHRRRTQNRCHDDGEHGQSDHCASLSERQRDDGRRQVQQQVVVVRERPLLGLPPQPVESLIAQQCQAHE